jgi:YVTN family beta-propeller protein
MNRKIINKNSARRAILLSLFIGILLFSALSSIKVAHAAYPTISVGSDPYGIAYASNGDIYVTNSGDNTVSVIDTSSNMVVKTIGVGSSPYGVAFANGDIYVANFGDNSVSVIDTSSNMVVKTIGVGTGPYGVAYDSSTGDIYVTNFGDDSVSVIATSSNTVVGTIGVGSGPIGVAFASSNGDNTWPTMAIMRLIIRFP